MINYECLRSIFSPSSVGTLRGSYGGRKAAGAWIAEAHGRERPIRCYLQYIHGSRHRQCALRLRRLAGSGWLRRVLLATVLSLWRRVHFGTWWSLFVAGARETSCLGASKSTFRDRCKGSELFYFEVQFSWQAQVVGHGGDRRGAQIS